MVERICPSCQHGNPLDSRFCSKCGTALERQFPMRASDSRLTVAGRSLPVTWQQLGRTVALSVAALAAEAGLAWLRRRVETGPAPASGALARTIGAAQPAAPEQSLSRPAASVVTIVSQRIVEIWESADGRRQVVERSFWQRTEQ